MARSFVLEPLIAVTRKVKCARFMLDAPDYFYRIVTGKEYLPPLSLRASVGDYRSFEAVGMEFLEHLKGLCGLDRTDSVLDIGCGCGRVALPLTQFLSEEGRYVGMDVMKNAIQWSKNHITPGHPNFQFYWVDLRNKCYSPGGIDCAEDYDFPFKDEEFDIIFLVSVFTHMLQRGVENYIDQISHILKKDGKCLMTFFLLNDVQRRLSERNLNRIEFRFGNEVCRFANKKFPERSVGYAEDYILDLCHMNSLDLTNPPHYGKWSGRSDGLSYQDIIVVSKG